MANTTFPQPTTLSSGAALDLMDKLVHKRFNYSADEFLMHWDAGEFRGSDSAAIAEIAALIPFIR